nr:hypothetical protein [Tanacetum cinerariifolium]
MRASSQLAGVAKLSYDLRTCPHLYLLEARVQFDQALRASLENVVTASGPRFGDWKWRLATFQIKLGGLGILSAGDIIQYAFLASRLQTSTLQTKILMKTDIESQGSYFKHALDVFNTTCNLDVLFVTTCTYAPHMMKTLAKCYFCVIEKVLVSKYMLSPRHVSILNCIRPSQAQDFLFTIPIDGLGQRTDHRQFHSVLCYRFTVPMFSEGSLCPSCNTHRMDQWGDHVVHCSSEVGVKFKHNLVRDILVDICSKVGIMVRNEASMGFFLEDAKDLRPADLSLFNWLQGKDACLDVACISPFAGTGATSCAPRVALHNAVEKKKRMYGFVCEENRYKFIPFSFSTFGEFDTDALDTLSPIKSIFISHLNNAKSGVFIFHKVIFCIQKRVRAQLVSRLSFNFMVWRLAMEAYHLTLCIWGLGVYSVCDVFSYAFLASRLQSVGLQTKLLRDAGTGGSGSSFEDALYIYFTNVTKSAEPTFSSSPRQMAVWESQLGDHTSDWIRAVLISGLGQTMNGKTYRCVLCYRLGVLLFSVLKPCSTCPRVFTVDIYRDQAVSCTGIIGIKHRHNVVHDTLVEICYWSLYSWDEGLVIHAVIDAAHHKRVKYETKCEAIGYGFLPFSFSYLGELEEDVVTLLKRIQKFLMTQDIGAPGKEVDIGLDGRRDKPLRPADMLLYSWDGGLDVCVDLNGSSPLTQTEMADFVPDRAMVNTCTDAELAAAVQNALQTLLPQIRAEIREEFRTGSGPSGSGGNPPLISHMEKIFDVIGCEDAFKTRLTMYKFEGDALAWWKAYKQAKGGDECLKREYHSIVQTDTETSTEFMPSTCWVPRSSCWYCGGAGKELPEGS